MNAILLLVGLLVLSYIGSFLVGGRSVRGMGLPSGSEYVALGFVLGPQVLGVLERSMLESFEPIAHVALGWLALVIGIDFGHAGDKRVRTGSLALGAICSILTGGAVAGATFLLLDRFPILPPGIDRWLLAGGAGAACAETTRHAVRWVVERHSAQGRLSQLFGEISHADDLIPLLAVAALFAFTAKSAHLPWHLPVVAWLGVTVVLGLALGAISALLIGREFSVHTTWGVLFGASLLAIGVATRLDLAPLSVTFFMGIGMAATSPHRALHRDAVAATERPVLLPALLLAGATIDLRPLQANRWLIVVIVVAVGARIVGKLASGIVLRTLTHSARGASPLLGLGLLSSGALSMSIGLLLAVRFPGAVGDTVLVIAAASAIFGEFFAPAALRRVLKSAGEVPEPLEASPSSSEAEAQS